MRVGELKQRLGRHGERGLNVQAGLPREQGHGRRHWPKHAAALGGGAVALGGTRTVHAAPFARQQLQEQAPVRRLGAQAFDGLLDGVDAGEGHERTVIHRTEGFHAGDHATVHRVPRAFGGVLWNERVSGLGRQRLRRDLLLRQPPAQIVEGERYVEQVRVLGGFKLLGDARSDKHDAEVLPKVLAQHLAVRQQGRKQAGEELGVGGPMLLEVADYGGAGRGIEHSPATFRQGRGRLRGNLLRTQSRFGHAEEAEPFERANELAGGQFRKLTHIRGGQRYHHTRLRSEHLPRLRQIIPHPLGGVRANFHAVSAQDAQLRHH